MGSGVTGLGAGTPPFRIVSLGDINRDGHDDYGVSIELLSGNVGVVMGGDAPATIVSGGFTSLYTGTGSQYIGHGLTTAGDLNDDGTVDMVAGSIESFLVVLLLRSSGSLLSSHVLNSASPGMPSGIAGHMRCGIGMGLLGRLDGDRYNEILMGCDAGGGVDVAAFTLFMGKGGVVRGHGATLASSPLLSPLEDSHSGFGFSATGIGDLDGDGLLDAAYGANIDDTDFVNTGTVVIGFMHLNGTLRATAFINRISGGTPVQTHLSTFGANWNMAEHISGCGDIDGDSVPDLLVGSANGGSPTDSGRVDIFFMNTDGTVKAAAAYGKGLSGLDTHIDLTVTARFGLSVFSAGDFTGTGKFTFGALVGGQAGNTADLGGSLVFVTIDETIPTGSRSWAQGLANDPPLVQAVRPLTADPAVAFSGNTALQPARSTIIGDLNGDGYFDLAFADFVADEVYIVMGQANGQFDATFAGHIPERIQHDNSGYVSPPSDNTLVFGHALTPAGDADLDGLPDLYVGALGTMAGSPTDAGSMWLLLLHGDGALKKGFEVTEGMPTKIANTDCGYGIGTLGDNNGDGFLEVLLGCGVTSGDAFVYLLYMGLNGVVGRSVVHTTAGDARFGTASVFGYAFAALGDLDGNGHLDYASLAQAINKLAVAFVNTDGTLNHFEVTAAGSPTLAGILEQVSAERLFESLSPAGDLNGDGVADLIVGGPARPTSGGFYILYMQADGTVQGGHRFEGAFEGFAAAYPDESSGDEWGKSVLWLGDYMGTGNGTIMVSGASTVGSEQPILVDVALPAIDLSLHQTPTQLVIANLPSNASFAIPGAASGIPISGPAFSVATSVASSSIPGFAAPEDRHFGSVITPMGDMNGDGFVDIIVGAPNEDTGQGSMVILYLDSAGVPLASPAPVVIDSFITVDTAGWCVCSHGGLVLPAHTGLVFGSPNNDGGKGRITYWATNSAGSAVAGTHHRDGATVNSRFGSACAIVGDVNGDGRADIAVGARGVSGTLEGIVQIELTLIYGTNSGVQTISGPSEAGQEMSGFGSSLAALGDVDGNGIPDLAVGEAASDFGGFTNSGSLTLLYLAFGGSELSRTVLHLGVEHPLFSVRPQGGHSLGTAIAPAGDVNEDGTIDLLIGDPVNPSQRGGFDLLLMGRGSNGQAVGATSLRRSFPSAVPDAEFNAGGRLGQGLVGLGDLNGDGFFNFAVGRPAWGENTERVLLLSSDFKAGPGACAGALHLAQVMCSKEDFALKYDTHTTIAHANFTQQSTQHNGFELSLIGDVDGDGFVDYMQGVSRWEVTPGTDVGRVYLFFTGTNFVVDRVVHIDLELVGPGSDFVSGLAGIGDLNADGVPDIIVGSAWLDSNRGGFSIMLLDSAGAAEVTTTYRSASPLVGTLAASQYCGRAVAALGDITGDTHMDVIMGCPGTQAVEAAVMVLSLRVNGFAVASEYSASPVATSAVPAFSGFGYSIASLGDLDDDGLVEVAVGCPLAAAAGGSIVSAGGLAISSVRANMTLGRATFLSASVAGRGQAETNGMFGSGMSFVGLMNGGEFPQLMVHTQNPGFLARGSLELLTLTPQRTVRVAARLDRLFGSMPLGIFGSGTQFGSGVAAVGDADGTGKMTYLVGNPNPTASSITQLRTIHAVGASYCAPELQTIKQCPGHTDRTLALSAVGTGTNAFPSRSVGDQLGSGLAIIGDLNGDGYVDFATGSPGSGAGAGGVYVVFGQGSAMAAGATSLSAQLITGSSLDPSASGVGVSVASAGDMNDDGVLDIFVGSPEHDSETGALVLGHLNSDGTLSSTKLLSSGLFGLSAIPANLKDCGWSLSALEDVNHDGLPELAFGCPSSTAGGSFISGVFFLTMARLGNVTAVSTLATPHGGSLGMENFLPTADTGFGISLSTLGDVDDNGISDVAVGQVEGAGGSVTIVFLSAALVPLTAVTIPATHPAVVGTAAGTGFGARVALIGDVSEPADGVPDLLVGQTAASTLADGSGALQGALVVLHLSADPQVGVKYTQVLGAVSDTIAELTSLAAPSVFASGLATLGDLDGDGGLDLLLASQHSAIQNDVTVLRTKLSYSAAADYSCSISSHIADSCKGAPSFRYESHTLVDGLATFGENVDHRTGFALALIGDLDGDGYPEYANGASRFTNSAVQVGRVYIVFTKAALQYHSHSTVFAPSATDRQRFGCSVAGIGDINRDGVPDLAVGSCAAGDYSGGFSIILLKSDGTELLSNIYQSGSPLLGTLASSDLCGYSLAPMGDVNGDLHMDLAVGCRAEPPATPRVMLVALRPMGTAEFKNDITGPFPTAGGQSLDSFGRSLAFLGDLGGNGTYQLAVGAQRQNDVQLGLSLTGAVFIVSIDRNYNMQGLRLIEYASLSAALGIVGGSEFGASLSAAGDLTGDGVPDLIAGVSTTGRVGLVLLHMTPDGGVKHSQRLDSVSGALPAVLSASPRFGWAVAAGGDRNSSGQFSVLVGDASDTVSRIAALTLTTQVPVGFCPPDLELLQECPGRERPSLMLSATQLRGDLVPAATGGDSGGVDITVIGDVDGDGFIDYAYGSYAANRVNVIFGRGVLDAVSSPTAVRASTILATQVSEPAGFFGHGIAPVTDLDDDGVPDIFVGQREMDSSRGGGHVIFLNANGSFKGHRTLFGGQHGFPATSGVTGRCGMAAGLLGDLDDDGAVGIAVGCTASTSAVILLKLLPSGSVSASHVILDVSNTSYPHHVARSSTGLGASVSAIGDLNGDGKQDMAAGSSTHDEIVVIVTNGYSWPAAVYTVSLSHPTMLGGFDTSLLYGFSVAGVGDVSVPPDGVPDIIIGQLGATAAFGGSSRGPIFILYLSNDPAVGVKGFAPLTDVAAGFEQSFDVTTAGAFPFDLDAIGDVDGDGGMDFLASGQSSVMNDRLWLVRSSAPAGTTHPCGVPFSIIADIDGATCEGQVLGSSQPLPLIQAISADGIGAPVGAANDRLGSSLAAIGDVDANGVLDIAMGGTGADTPVYILFMRSGTNVSSSVTIPNGVGNFAGMVTSGAGFGRAIAPLGLVNGDTIPDIAVGEPLLDDQGTATGAVWVLMLAYDGTVAAHNRISNTPDTGTLVFDGQCGSSLAGLGQSSTSAPMLAVGCPRFGSDQGMLQVLHLDSSGVTAAFGKVTSDEIGEAPAFTVVLPAGGQWARSLAALGPVNADGFGDIAVGADSTVHILFLDGDAEVLGFATLDKFTPGLESVVPYLSQFGRILGTAGDTNGDGVGDLLIGHAVGTAKDELWLLQLNASASLLSAQRVIPTDLASVFLSVVRTDDFGVAAIGLGDATGNGKLDIIVGMPGMFSGAGSMSFLPHWDSQPQRLSKRLAELFTQPHSKRLTELFTQLHSKLHSERLTKLFAELNSYSVYEWNDECFPKCI